MKNRITKKVVTAAILSVLITAMLCASAFAASYSKVYGRTKDRLRVRASASSSATVIDNIIKDACVYISTSQTSGSSTFVKVTYRNSDGNIDTGWVCQHDGSETLVTILTATQAQNWYNVKSGNLPSKRVGTFTASERAAAEKTASTSSSSSSSTTYTASYIKEIQTMLSKLGYYYGEVTGNIGSKTETAIKKFQSEYKLSADGIPGPNTYARLKEIYNSKGYTSSSSSSSSGSGLRLNSTGSDVRNLQQDLKTLGYYWAEVTGNFGEKTEAAVKRFQQKHNLTADGVAGTATLQAIESALRTGGYSSSTTVSTSGTLSLGTRSEAVEDLQTALKNLGYYGGSITGHFGEKTREAVRDFQAANGLTADGIAGTKTLQAINNGSSSSSSSTGSRLAYGSTGTKVTALQKDLTALGYYTGEVSGHYGTLTEAAVKKFQKAKGLPQDGVAGTATQNAIVAALGNSGSLAGTSSSSSGTLKLGDKGSAVTDLQTRLEKLDYYYGEITGTFGTLTEKAVKKFQDDNDLTVDGKAGTKTLQLLYQKTGSSYTGTTSNGSVTNGVKYGQLNTDNVSLRKSYSKSSQAVIELDKGHKMRITQTIRVDGMDWYFGYVESGSYTYKGYMRSDYIDIISYESWYSGGGNKIDSDYEVLGMIRVTANNVAIREDHDVDSDRIGYAYKNDLFYYINTRTYDGGWYQIQSGGWIHKDYCVRLSEDEMDEYAGSSTTQTSYKLGDKGTMVTWIQESLKTLKYYKGEITGNYGNKTHDAVMDFQRDHGISGDGIAGTKTIAKIREALAGKVGTAGSSGTIKPSSTTVYNINWFNYLSAINAMGVKKGATVTLTDIQTGKSFDAYVQSTGNHIDAEPKTANDTKVLASLYGVSTGNDLYGIYKRRPLLLTTSTGYNMIVSIYPEPHGDDTISTNSYDGQFCLHMLGSKTHGTDRVDTDTNGHQQMIEKGVGVLTTTGVNGVKYEVKTSL